VLPDLAPRIMGPRETEHVPEGHGDLETGQITGGLGAGREVMRNVGQSGRGPCRNPPHWLGGSASAVRVVRTPDGLRALTKDKPDDPAAVTRYLEGKFGEAFPEVRTAMAKLARSFPPKELATRAYSLYEQFRPAVPTGTRGWGAKGDLDLEKIKGLAP
jgi:hypothetical protein